MVGGVTNHRSPPMGSRAPPFVWLQRSPPPGLPRPPFPRQPPLATLPSTLGNQLI